MSFEHIMILKHGDKVEVELTKEDIAFYGSWNSGKIVGYKTNLGIGFGHPTIPSIPAWVDYEIEFDSPLRRSFYHENKIKKA